MASPTKPVSQHSSAELSAVPPSIVSCPKCTQCGKKIHHLPFAIAAITCRECYGLQRYQRGIGMPIGANSMAALAAEERRA